MPQHLYKRVLKGSDEGNWIRSDLASGRDYGPAAKYSRVDADGADGDEMLFARRGKPVLFRRRTSAALDLEPLESLPETSSTTFTRMGVCRYPDDVLQRLDAALLATGAEYAVALDNGLLPFAQQKGQGRRLAGGATYWSVNKVLGARKPKYPRLSTAKGRTVVAHNPDGNGVVVADDVFVWDPEPAPAPSEWLAYAPDYLDLDFEPEGLPVVFCAIDIGDWGGVIVLCRLVEDLCALGVNAQLMHAVHHKHSIKMPFSPRKVESNQWKDYPFKPGSVVVRTNWWSGSFLPDRDDLIPVSFMQDCESRFRNTDGEANITKAVADRYLAVPNRVANSPWVVDAVVEDHEVEPMPWIPIGIDTRKFYPEPKADDPLRIIAMWRPCTPRRGSERLEALYERLKKTYGKKVSLDVFGETKPAPKVVDKHWGWLSADKVAEVMRGAAICVEPSDYQGWGMVPHQAISCGSALVSTRCGGPEAFATHDENAWFVEHDDLFEGVCRVIDDADLRHRLQEAGPPSVAHTAWPEVGKQWKAYLEGLAAQRGLTLG